MTSFIRLPLNTETSSSVVSKESDGEQEREERESHQAEGANQDSVKTMLL